MQQHITLFNKIGRQCFLIATFILLAGPRVLAQSYYFRHYSIDKGLVQSQVLRIFQDSEKYMWLGTYGGVSRFDGTDFTNYTRVDGLTGDLVNAITQANGQILVEDESGVTGIRNGHLKNILKLPQVDWGNSKQLTADGSGRLWIIRRRQLNIITGNKLQPVWITSRDECVMSIALNRNGKLCASIYGNGIYRYDKGSWTKIVSFDGAAKEMGVLRMLFDRFNPAKIYMLTPSKLYEADGQSINEYRNQALDTLKRMLYSVAQDRQGNLWLGTDKGAYYLRKNSPIYFNGGNGFSNNTVYDIYIDSQDNVWLGTNGDGFYKFEGLDLVNISRVDGNPLSMIMDIGQDEAGNVWMGTYGQGLVKFDGHKYTGLQLPSAEPLSKFVVSIAYKKGQPVLFGTLSGLWMLDKGKMRNIGPAHGFPPYINRVMYDEDNTIWAASLKGVFYLKKNGESGFVKGIEGDPETVIPVGKDSVLVGKRHDIVLLKNGVIDPDFKFDQLATSTILCLLRYKNTVIGGTLSEGLFFIDLAKKTIKKYNTHNGLRTNAVYSLLADSDGTIWAGTGTGIEKFRIGPGDHIHFIRDLTANPIIEFNQDAIYKIHGKIWAGGTQGLYMFNTGHAPDAGMQRPQVNLESVRIYEQGTGAAGVNTINLRGSDIPRRLKLNYSNKHITVSYKGIYYPDPESVLYQYRLSGLDKQFSVPTKANMVDFTSLPPGDYTLQIRAIAANGLYSPVCELPVTIYPAFYQTAFFYILLLLLFLMLGILIQWVISYRKVKQNLVLDSIKHQEQIRVRRQTSEDFHDDIGNKLTRIVVLTDILERKSTNQSPEIKSIVNQLKENAANLYSGARDILWSLDPKSDDLQQILLKIKNIAIDMFGNTDTEVIFDEFDVDYNKSLPLEYSRNTLMIFKELLNNVLKHARASKVILKARITHDEVELIVIDDGVGFDVEAANTGRGMSNIRTRAAKMQGNVHINSSRGIGTTVRLKFGIKV